MKKKILACALALVCAAGAFSAVTAIEEPVSMEAAAKKAPTLNQVYNAAKGAYGSDYLPSDKLGKNDINERYGLSSSWYKGAIAEVPMMSAQVDELVIVKAKNADTKKKIKQALKSYQKTLKEDRFQYPANLSKIQGSRVYVKGKYVCFIMLGTISNATEEQGEAQAIAAYKRQNEKAVTAIKNLYK